MIKKQIAMIFRIFLFISIVFIILFEASIQLNKSKIEIVNEKTECYNICIQKLVNMEMLYQKESVDIYNQKEYKLFLANGKKLAAKREQLELKKKKEKLAREVALAKEAIKKEEVEKEEEPEEKKEVFTYEATFYTAKCNGCTGVTSSGYKVTNTIFYNNYRIVAAPKDIKLYTILKITLEDGTEMKAIVLDRGGSIKKNRLDILVGSKKEAYQLGRQDVKVEIVE